MNILQISSLDYGGGAEGVARLLFEDYERRGHDSFLAVGAKQGDHPRIISVAALRQQRLWPRLVKRAGRFLGIDARWPRAISALENPARVLATVVGYEDFRDSVTASLASTTPAPDIIHAHNLHGGYFSLRALTILRQAAPIFLTLHDSWMLTGHCAHSFDCERWMIGCGGCPDLNIYPAVRRDETRRNAIAKRRILRMVAPRIGVPCEWLAERVRRSGIPYAELRVIPYGIDLATFHPGSSHEARRRLGLPLDAKVVLFVANALRTNPWKDFEMLFEALSRLGRLSAGVTVLAVGDGGRTQQMGSTEIQFRGFVKDPATLADYYRAADVYVHPAKIDTFPNVILEAMACGLPVVATSVGGVPEQVIDGETGYLVPKGESEALTRAIESVLFSPDRGRSLSAMAVKRGARFDRMTHASAYLNWYEEVIAAGGEIA